MTTTDEGEVASPAPRIATVSPPTSPPAGDRPWRRALRAALPIWGTAYLAYIGVSMFAWFHPAAAPQLRHFFDTWLRYDAVAYALIVDHGYSYTTPDTLPAFFPLYPMLGWAANFVVPGGARMALIAVSAVALLAMLTVFHRLVEWEFDQEVAGRAIWLIMLFPTAFFLALGFNESLFIALMLGSIYAMRRGYWWLAGVLGLFAVLTRSIGILLCLAFAYEYLRQRGFSLRRIRPDILAVTLIPAGLGAFMLYLWAVVGDPLAFVHRMAPWGRELSWPWTGLVQTVQWLPNQQTLSNTNLHLLLDLSTVVFVAVLLTLAFVGPWRLRHDQLLLPILGAAMLLYQISFPPAVDRGEPLIGSPRYVLEIVAAFIVLARILPVQRLYTFGALMLQGLLLAHLVRGGWIA